MALKILKFGEKEVALSLSEAALETLVEAGLCTEGTISDEFLLDKLKKGYLLIPHDNDIKLQKIKTLKTKGECVTIDNLSIPLTTVRDIAEYVRTGETSGDVRKRSVGQKTMVTFLQDFFDIKAGKKILASYSTVNTKYGDLKINQLERDGIVKKEKEDAYEANFIVSSPYSYYNNRNDYNVRVNNGTVSIGCKTFKTSYMKRLGKILKQYLAEEK